MKIELRLTTTSDKEFARLVHHSAYREVVIKQFGTWDEKLQDGFFEKGWRPGLTQIIQVDGKDAGCLLQEIHDNHVKLVEIQLLPRFQGRGVGKRILNDMIRDASQRRLPIRLEVLKENFAKDLYLKIGFVTTGETATHLLMEYADNRNR